MLDPAAFICSAQPFAFYRRDAVAFLRQLPDDSIDAFVSDPPYGIELKLGTKRNQRSIRGDGRREARHLWRAFIPEAFRVAKPDTAHLFFGSWKSPWMHALLARHFAVKGCIVWDKRIIGLGHYLRPRWEMIYFCTKGRPPRADHVPADLWDHCRVQRPRHPCEKPIELLRRAVSLVAPPGALAADPFAGITSTGVAALAEGRRFIGSEVDPRHHRLGLARLEDALQSA